MRVAFFSNYLNHHQLAFCETMDRLTDHHFLFVAFMPTPRFRVDLGYPEMNDQFPFVLKAYEDKVQYAEAMAVAVDYDLVLFGTAPQSFVELRMKHNRLTFRYSERLFRETPLQALSPRGMLHRIKEHTRYMRKDIYLLCASAFASFDFMISGAYIGKAYKWGYFPPLKHYDCAALWERKQLHNIIWVGRLIHLKHPEQAIEIAERLKEAGVPFTMNIIGDGELKEMLEQMIQDKNLNDHVCLNGKMNPETVRSHMETASIFLFTSDFHEGWGAVLNEAMNSGCAVVASHAIGSVPFMIKDNVNGLVYESGNTTQLYSIVRKLLGNPKECQRLGMAAYKTICNEWNAETAAKRLLQLADDLKMKKKSTRFVDGPCSRATPLFNQWYKLKHKQLGKR